MEEEDTLLASMKEAIDKEKSEASTEDDTEQADETEAKADAGEEVDEDSDSDDQDETKTKDKQVEDEDSEDDSEPTRGQTRHQKLANQLKEERAERAKEREEREKLIAERATLAAQLEHERQSKTAGQSGAEKRAEEERLQLLSPEERMAYNADRRAQALEQRINAMEWQTHDGSEKAAFRAQAAHDPLVEKFQDEVERMRAEDLKKG